MKKPIKIISVIAFAIFYVASIFISNFPYPEYASTPTFLNVGSNIWVLVSFYFMTFVFSGSKKFFITVCIYFASIILSIFILSMLGGFNGSLITTILLLILLSILIPTIHLEIFESVSSIISPNNDIAFYLFFGFVIILFFIVYFVAKHIKSK